MAVRDAFVAPTELEVKIKSRKMYISVVNLSTENDAKLLKELKSGFERTINWNKYRSEMSIQAGNNSLNYLNDPTFTKVNRLFVLSSERIPGENNTAKEYRDSFSN